MAKAWIVRATINGKNYAKEFYEKYTIGIGYGKYAAFNGLTKKGIKELLSGEPYKLTGLDLGSVHTSVNNFVNEMAICDIVLIPDGDDIYFVEVQSEYMGTRGEPFSDSNDIENIRKIKPLAIRCRKELSMDLRKALKLRGDVADITKHYEEVYALAFRLPYEPKEITVDKMINVSFPLRPDVNITFKVPSDMTDDEAMKLSEFFKTIYFQKG